VSIDFNNRRFVSVSNSASGEVGSATVFHYRQSGDLVWATYEGGTIRFGTLVALVAGDGGLDMRYQHVNDRGEFRSGRCRSRLEVLPDRRYRLHEQWTWSNPRDGESGESVVEEVR
jgi:hypothetical protein